MNIKELDKFKRVAEYFVDTLPLDAMEFDIQESNDPLIKRLYNSLLDTDQLIDNPRYKILVHNFGIVQIYVLFDVCYAEPMRWILAQSRGVDIQVINPENWRINK